MSGMGEFITVFSSFSLLFGGMYLLKPAGNTAKTVKFVFSLIFICIMLSAILNIKLDDFKSIQTDKSVEISTETLKNEVIRLTFMEALRLANINFTEITVCTNKNADGSISISKVIVYSGESKEKIIKALSNADAEYEIEVCYE